MSRVAALVLVVDPMDRARLDPQRVSAVLGLTGAQGQIAVALTGGKTLRDIAEETGRTLNTSKWHMRQIATKHNLSGQVDLVRRVMSLAYVWAVRS